MPEGFDPYHRWLGIPPEQQPASHYRLLGLEPLEDDADAIRAAAERHMMHVRSYQSGKYAAEAERLLNEISAAKVCLLDPTKKAHYDHRLRIAKKSASEVPLVSPDAPRPVVLVGELLPAEPNSNLPALVRGRPPAKFSGTALAPLQRLAKNRNALTVAALALGASLVMVIVACGGLTLWVTDLILDDDSGPAVVDTDSPTTIPSPPSVDPPVPPVVETPRDKPIVVKRGESIDLIPLVNPTRDTVSGAWQITGGEIIAQPAWFSRLEIPVIPPAEYDLEVIATRTTGNEDLIVGMVYQGRPCGAALDGWSGTASGLSVDNAPGGWGAILRQQQKLITNGQRMTVRCTVRADYLAVTANGKEFLRYAGAPSWRANFPGWSARDARFLTLGTMSSTYHIHSVKLTPITGNAIQAARPAASPAAVAAGAPAYLDDLRETSVQLGYGTLGKHGSTGYPYNITGGGEDPTLVRVAGKRYTHALSTHPSGVFPATVSYDLGGKYRTLTTSVGIMDQTKQFAFAGELVFSVQGDGRKLWESTALTKHGQLQSATINVAGVQRLELVVYCKNSFPCAWAVWLEPQVR